LTTYTMSAKLDPVAHTIAGSGSITLINVSALPLREAWMHLYLNGFKNESQLFLRQSLGPFRGSEPISDWGYIDLETLSAEVWQDGKQLAPPADVLKTVERSRPGDADETDARVPLPFEVPTGAELRMQVKWLSKLPTIVERTGHYGSFHFAGQWFPKLAKLERQGEFAHFPFHHLSEFYADFGTYDVTLDVPAGFVIGATGPITEQRDENQRHIERHVQTQVHDFAFTAWDKFQERKERIDGIEVRALFGPGYETSAERELASLRHAIPHFKERYGPYPYSVLTVVHPPEGADEAGGMEYPTLITTGGPWYGPPGIHILELVTVHEFGHQYFYGLLGSNEWRWPFLDEGLNSYAEATALAGYLGHGSVSKLFGIELSDYATQALSAQRFTHDVPVSTNASLFPSGRHYGSLVYARTAAILETMRRVYGDKPMEDTLRAYASEMRFGHPTPTDLFRHIEKGLGDKARVFAESALMNKGFVDFAAVQITRSSGHAPRGLFDRDGKRETISTGETAGYGAQVLIVRRGTLKVPVDVEFVAEDGTRSRKTWDGEAEWTLMGYDGKSPLRSAIVDPDRKVLLDQNAVNNFVSVRALEKKSAPRTNTRLWTLGNLLLRLISP
jgi:hypothetical protein